jgi:hypothetical protein
LVIAREETERLRPIHALLAVILNPRDFVDQPEACGRGNTVRALQVIALESEGDLPDETLRQHALREVVQHCIYGVDRNPLAVELCLTALWIETIEPGKPLSFLDARIRCGESLQQRTRTSVPS